MSQYSDIRCFTVFAPNFNDSGPLPITDFSIRNAHGSSEPPDTVINGHYRFDCPDEMDLKRITISHTAYNASGDFRHVDVVPSHFGGGGTRFDVFVKDEDGNLTTDFTYCEVTVKSLPIS